MKGYRMGIRWMVVGGLLIALPALSALGKAEDAPESVFEVKSEFGSESDWTQAYLQRAARVLARWMDAPDVAPPARIAVELRKDPNLGGIAGAAGPTTLSFTSNLWPEERYRRWILAHELANLMACHYGGAGGYPSDWWSNGRSPFPEYVAVLLMAHLGHVEDAAWRKAVNQGKKDHELFWHLHRLYGFELFARFLALVREDGLDIGRIGKAWPNADESRSAYTIAYLSLAAGKNLAELVRSHDIGDEPADWRAIHPDKPFEPYVVTPGEVERVLAERERLFGDDSPDPKEDEVARYHGGGALER